jgi:hypothetical protein
LGWYVINLSLRFQIRQILANAKIPEDASGSDEESFTSALRSELLYNISNEGRVNLFNF